MDGDPQAAEGEGEGEDQLTFYRFIQMAEKRQLDKIRQVKNKVYLRRLIKEQVSYKVHIIPSALARGIKNYQQPETLSSQIASSRFPQDPPPTKRVYSEEIARKGLSDRFCKMPNLKLFYRRDELNSIKESAKYQNILEQMEDKEHQLRRIRLSLPATIDKKRDYSRGNVRYGQHSPSHANCKVSNPEKVLKN